VKRATPTFSRSREKVGAWHSRLVEWIAPGEKHWHGASPTVAMIHYAMHEALDDKHVEWLEKVTDEEYGA